jgi:hypothetical protein
MPRSGGGVYSAPVGTEAVAGTTIESTKYNALVNDLVADANAARPVSAGGTGAANAADARTNLGISATNTPFTPAGSIAATNTQAAIVELDGDVSGKAALAGSGSQVFSVAAASADAHALNRVTADSRHPRYDATASLSTSQREQLAANVGSGILLVASGTIAGGTSQQDITIPTGFVSFRLNLQRLEPATSGAAAHMRFSRSGSYISGATDYISAARLVDDLNVVGGFGSSGASVVALSFAQAASGGSGGDFDVLIYPGEVGNAPRVNWTAGFRNSSSRTVSASGFGGLVTAGRIDGVRLLFSSGNISNGAWQLYGMRG